MAQDEVLARREQIESEIDTLTERRQAALAARRRIQEKLRAIPRDRQRMLHSDIDDLQGELRAQREREAELREDLATQQDVADSAHARINILERKLVSLHAHRFAEFAEAAEQASANAEHEIAALREQYEKTRHAVDDAQIAWRRPTRDYNSLAADVHTSPTVARQRAVVPDLRPNPLGPFSELDFTDVLRPDLENVDLCDFSLDTFVNDEGREIRASVGSEHHKLLSTSESWQVVPERRTKLRAW